MFNQCPDSQAHFGKSTLPPDQPHAPARLPTPMYTWSWSRNSPKATKHRDPALCRKPLAGGIGKFNVCMQYSVCVCVHIGHPQCMCSVHSLWSPAAGSLHRRTHRPMVTPCTDGLMAFPYRWLPPKHKEALDGESSSPWSSTAQTKAKEVVLQLEINTSCPSFILNP